MASLIMLSNTSPVGKLYLSIIDDVIENMRELFLDEGLEDRVLDDLRHLWESKMMQSKAMEDFRKNNINTSNFVLQLPAGYTQPDQELAASVVIPSNQNIRSFPVKSNTEALATFSLPAGLPYPVQIPAGVTLQTASGQLYKVNVPVVVTQAPAGQRPLSQPAKKVADWKEAPAPLSAVAPRANVIHPQGVESPPAAAPSVTQLPQPKTSLPPNQEDSAPPQTQGPAVPTVGALQLPWALSPQPEATGEENEPQAEAVNLTGAASGGSPSSDPQAGAEEALTEAGPSKIRDLDDILKEMIEKEAEKVERARNLASAKPGEATEDDFGLDLDYSAISDIVQLDGAADSSDTEEEALPLEENDFLGIINAEAIKALQEGVGSSEGNSVSSSSDSEGGDELANVEEEDPLNSGDDVIEQDIPDLFDTDNVIVCQYDKIHRSKNRWKFHLKDGVMCYEGRDYVFSKAVGEAEW